MTVTVTPPGSASFPMPARVGQERASTTAPPGAGAGLGGNTLAHILESSRPGMLAFAGVVIEQLDAQAGAWQFSTDAGQTWRPVRTDLINRPGNLGLALDRDALLRVLPFGGHRVRGARVVFHTVQRSHGLGNGSYRAYAGEEREGGSATRTMVLALTAINGAPPALRVPRPRNKRATARRAALPAPVTVTVSMALV